MSKNPTQYEETTLTAVQPVKAAQLHSAAMCTGANTTLNEVKLPGAEMYWEPGNGLHIHRRGKKHLIPAANVLEVEYL